LSMTGSLIALAILLLTPSWAASNSKVLYNFTGGNDGGDPATPLSFDASGNAYGTTVTGGSYGCGTVFQLKPVGSGWQQHTLWAFTCLADGKNPYGGVILDAAGDLYGTTVAGGSGGTCAGDGCGTVFKLTQSRGNWSENVLYNFTGGNDGFGPGSGVVSDDAGNLYGTTPDGGLYSMGVVYELSRNGTFTVIHAFTGGADGGVGSLGSLLYNAGKFYGVSEIGGTAGAGTAFQLTPGSASAWTFATIHQFLGQPHAGFPYGGLIADPTGRLYGTTYFGGATGNGTVYVLALADGNLKETVAYSFRGGMDGSFPTSTLVFDQAGNLYGTTSTGGNPGCDCGTVFEISPVNGGVKETVLHSFASTPDGAYPNYGLTLFDNNLYGSTPVGGTQNQGIVFRFTP
jgi:uncharacterized repeat protein (TIGR03803 family)